MRKLWDILKQLFMLFVAFHQGKQVAAEEIQKVQEDAYHEHADKIQQTVQETNATIIASYSDHELRRRMREQCTVPTKKNAD